MSGVPYTFASATSSIPLSQLDANFATTATLGNASVGLGNTTTTVGNLTVSNVTINGLSGGSANGVVYINSSNTATANASVLALDGNGNFGVGIIPSAWSGEKAIQFGNQGSLAVSNTYNTIQLSTNWYAGSGGDTYIGSGYAGQYAIRGNVGDHKWYVAPSGSAGGAITWVNAMSLDNSGNLGLGVTPSAWGSIKALQIVNSGFGGLGGGSYVSANAYQNGSNWIYTTSNYATLYQQSSSAGTGSHQWYIAPSGTAGSTVSFTQAMTLQLATFVSGSFQNVLLIKDSANTVSTFNAVNSTSWNSSVNSAMVLGSANGRSISAAGTLNASGADYAEYMTKSGDFTINKGDICGIDVNGKLTNVFANAISFVVKSTNPSYVGGDNWGNEEVLGAKPVKPTQAENEPDADYQTALTTYETALTAWNEKAAEAQKMVDRIAFSGQVPVNVTSATAGQYIVPVANQDGSIGGQAISESAMTLQQYMQSVGKVISVVGNVTTIIVKVA